MEGGRVVRFTMILLVVSSVVAGIATSVGAATTCSFDAPTATVTVGVATPEIERVGDAVAVDGVACDAATTSNTDTIVIPSSVAEVTIDLRGGPFEPGMSPEATGDPEIEFVFEPGSVDAQLLIQGTDGPDRFKPATVGDSETSGVNLNASEVPKDVDVTFPTDGVEFLFVRAGTGDDMVLAHGHGEHPYLRTLWVWGGGGDDRMTPGDGVTRVGHDGTLFVAGPGADTFDVSWLPRSEQTLLVLDDEGGAANGGGYAFGLVAFGNVEEVVGHDGRDVLIGDGDGDTLVGLGGPDELRGRAGDDTLLGGRGADEIRGGRGTDTCEGGTEDEIASCERRSRAR